MKSQVQLALLALVGLAGAGQTAQAQLTGVNASTAYQPFQLGTASAAVYQNGVITGSRYSTTMTGDISVAGPPTISGGSFTAVGYDLFQVGSIPIEIRNLRFNANYKVVNSGGAAPYPASTIVQYALTIHQMATPSATVISPNDPAIFTWTGSQPTLVGNGFSIVDTSADTGMAPYVLIAGFRYYFDISVSVYTSWGLQPNFIWYGNSLEFGGPQTSGTLTGFTASFDYRPVPAPASALACAVLSGLAVRRKRR